MEEENKIKCKNYPNTFIASTETLPFILSVLISKKGIKVYKVLKCDCGGWHIFTKLNNKYADKKLHNESASKS